MTQGAQPGAMWQPRGRDGMGFKEILFYCKSYQIFFGMRGCIKNTFKN